MNKIHKIREPSSLRVYRNQKNAIYDGPNFTPDVKNDIKDSLLEEQGHICAYCMQGIKKSNMKVEHFLCQHSHRNQQLNYKNLLGCCKGGEGSKKSQQTCDTRKGSDILLYSPAMKPHHNKLKIKYLINGTITSDDIKFNAQLNNTLNLNNTRFKKNRVEVSDAINSFLNKEAGSRTKAELQKVLNKLIGLNKHGKYKPFHGYASYLLEKRIKRMK
tara:strand:+ start:4708 stop:5355 length:648 start_codon:yes stop_codon:yes gene_type:complete